MVYILMASYNGEKYIKEQIDSILGQSYKDIRLIIQDDNSQDRTMNILKQYEAEFPTRIKVLQNSISTGSAKNNFINLLQKYKDKDYVMLSDQDDVWKKDKVKITLQTIKAMEKKHGKDIPCLVHTDVSIVDEKLNIVAESMEKYQNLQGKQKKLNKFIIQNSVTGCTTCINKALLELIKPEGKNMIMHDGYLGLLAAAFGQIEYIKEATMLYRQHDNNQVGAKEFSKLNYQLNLFLKKKNEIRNSIDATYHQAKLFLDIHKRELESWQIKLLEEYIDIPNQNKLKRCVAIIKLGTLKNGFSRRIGQFLFI